jgi:glycosyltransferase involved in cell wall biosynthesis
MIVGKIWDSEYPWDVRVEKVCATLVEAGHQVHLACRNRRLDPLEEMRDGIRIHRMPPWSKVPGAIDRAGSFPAFFNPRWRHHVLNTFRSNRVGVILCRDLPLAPMALSAGRELKVPVILDIAEHYPGLLKDLYNRQDFKLANLAVRNPILAGAVERWSFKRADAIWVVVDEMADRIAGMGVPRERIAVVSNTPTEERARRMRENPRSASGDGDKLRLVYHGNVERSRGLATVLRAMKLLEADTLQVTLDVFGDGRSLAHEKALAVELELGHRVRFHGRKPYDEILNQLGDYDAGIIPHHATDHWNYTIQNKLFDYMAAGLPVIASDMPPAARIVSQSGAGLYFPDRDPAGLRNTLLKIRDPHLRYTMGAAGRKAVADTFNWTNDSSRILRSLASLAEQGPRND